jgi:hypothetical protein
MLWQVEIGKCLGLDVDNLIIYIKNLAKMIENFHVFFIFWKEIHLVPTFFHKKNDQHHDTIQHFKLKNDLSKTSCLHRSKIQIKIEMLIEL